MHAWNNPWSPALKKLCKELLYWQMRLDHYKVLHGHVRQLIIFPNKLNIKYDSKISDIDMIDKIKIAHTKRKTVKE